MEPIITLLLPSDYELEEIGIDGPALVIRAAIHQSAGRCPCCGCLSTSIHGYYRRRLDDLPLSGFTVRIQLKVRRFRCNADHCVRRTFNQEMSALVAPYQRKSARLISSLYHIGQALGGRAGARLANRISMSTSRDTLLRIVRTLFQSEPCRPEIIGVDDWAMRRGHTYGTIIVDLERHQVIDRLPTRSAEELAAWLKQQPQVAIVSRDRSSEYRAAITEALPNASQVVDRWHLIKNLRDVLERSIEEIYATSNRSDAVVSTKEDTQELRTKFIRATTDMRQRKGRRQQRIRRYQMVQACKARGLSIRRIANLLGLARGTVRDFYRADTYPEPKQRMVKPSILDPYLPYLEERVQDGCMRAKQLWRESVAQGYPGTASQVSKWVTWRRRQERNRATEALAPVPEFDPALLPSRRTLTRILFAHASDLDPQDSLLLNLAKAYPSLAVLSDAVQELRNMIATKETANFDQWLSTCSNSAVAALQRFAQHLQQDRLAMMAAISSQWSNGQIEGQVNRLKMLKRQMYGRAKLDLLRARVRYSIDTP
jgi:transposase